MRLFNTIQSAVRRTLLGACIIGTLIATPSASAAGCRWLFAGNGTLEHSLRQGDFVISFTQLSQNDEKFAALVKLDRLKTSFGGWDYIPVDTGKAKGTLVGNVLSFVVSWSSGAKGDYKGSIDIYGNISEGITVDVQHPESTASWTLGGFNCVPIEEPTTTTPESSAPNKPVKRLGKRRAPIAVKEVEGGLFKDMLPQAPPAQPPQKTATAIDDVDIYKGPGGEFDRYDGFMEAGTEAAVLGHEEGWYKLKLNVPGGSGWVAEDHLTVKP